MQTTSQSVDNVAFPPMYIKPCLELVHGATTRLDELCNTIVNFLRCNCVPDEAVQLLPKSGTRRDAVVKYPVQGKHTQVPVLPGLAHLWTEAPRRAVKALRESDSNPSTKLACRAGVECNQQAVHCRGGRKDTDCAYVTSRQGVLSAYKGVCESMAQFSVQAAVFGHQGHDVCVACAPRATH